MYPDASLVCGELEFYRGRNDVILNPMLVVEVLSPSTREYDLGMKESGSL
jgi:Uma2 family endonuclease